MKLSMNRLISFVLAMLLVISVLPASAMAQTEPENTMYIQANAPEMVFIYSVNPLLEGTLDAQKLFAGKKPPVSTMESISDYGDFNFAANEVKQAIANRQDYVIAHYKSNRNYNGNICMDLLNKALEHNGNPKQGDYMAWHIIGRGVGSQTDIISGTYYYTCVFQFLYSDDASRERRMDTAVDALLEDLDLYDVSDYYKIKGIYDWMCANITYDYEHLYDSSYLPQFSAYAALIDRTAVCQGYALLFYRLAMELGVDSRLITSFDHAWNIVELNNLYYNVDSTWDAGMGGRGYNYFLLSDETFTDHQSHVRSDESEFLGKDFNFTSAAFYQKYPMSHTDYSHTHTHDYDAVVTAPTCTERGYTTYTCECGDSYVSDYVKELGHDWHPATCTEPETCYRCDLTRGEALGHRYEDGYCTGCGRKEPVEGEGIYRFAGDDRYLTAIAVADQLKINLGVAKFRNVVVAYGQNFPDALSGSYLAYLKDAPILLTQPSAEKRMIAYIEENLEPGGTAYLLGDSGVVPQSFENALEDCGFRIVRLAGPTRYETNMAILREAGIRNDMPVLIATGKNYADSLSASATGLPILLVDKKLNNAQKDFLRSTSREFVILGGYNAVSEEVEAELAGMGSVIRLKGANRYVTSVLIARKYFPDANSAVLAYAQGFPDGLCGGPLALSMGAPLILATNESHTDADIYVDGITYGAVTGGDDRISDKTVRDIFDLPYDEPIEMP